MANAATLVDTITCIAQNSNSVLEYAVSIDTINSDLTVYTPTTSSNRIFVVGMLQSESNPGNLILKSGATSAKTKTLELAAYQGIYSNVSPGWIYATKPGEALIIQSSMIITNLTLYLREAISLSLR